MKNLDFYYNFIPSKPSIKFLDGETFVNKRLICRGRLLTII